MLAFLLIIKILFKCSNYVEAEYKLAVESVCVLIKNYRQTGTNFWEFIFMVKPFIENEVKLD